MANPSSPSVKFTALDEPTITNTEKGIKNQPRLIIKFLKKMGKAIYHRGPDSDGIFISDNFGLGIQRLKIIDLKKSNLITLKTKSKKEIKPKKFQLQLK